jgi:hypothetical protein
MPREELRTCNQPGQVVDWLTMQLYLYFCFHKIVAYLVQNIVTLMYWYLFCPEWKPCWKALVWSSKKEGLQGGALWVVCRERSQNGKLLVDARSKARVVSKWWRS